MNTQRLVKQYGSFILSGMAILVAIAFSLLMISAGVVVLGYILSYFSSLVLHGEPITPFHYIVVVLTIACTAGLGLPVILLARNIQRSTENFSLLQFDDENEDEDEEYEGEEVSFAQNEEELNEFLKKLHKTRNIGPFIPSPKSMDDLCPCGSGLKYKDCCGRFWA